MKDTNPDFVTVDQEYLGSLPKGTDRGNFKPSPPRDYGPALASQIGRDVQSALSVKLRGASIGFDLHTMDQVGVWQDGFLDLNQTQHQRLRGEGYAQIDGDLIDNLSGWQWGHDGTLDYSRDGLLPRGPLPKNWLQYDGHYLFGDQLLLSYRIDERRVLHLPTAMEEDATRKQKANRPGAVRHVLQIGAGQKLVFAVAKPVVDPGAPRYQRIIAIDKPNTETDAASGSIAISGERDDDVLGSFASARVFGDSEGLTWKIDNEYGLVLQIPADQESRRIEVVCLAGDSEEDLKDLIDTESSGIDPSTMTQGGELRWNEPLKTQGYRGFQQGGYAVDTISIPESTPWNTWFRTSAVDFFPDGRLVVATVGGDIWIVSGVDDDLMDLSWKRFAAGLYEPFGVKVVGGLIYVTCKDRLTRLHDLNSDGEADYYESFSADTDVSTFFHAFNFDLQTDSQGNFYYAKAGQYTDYQLPGAVIKVSPDGKHRSVVCTGFRTPNGMGILPDDRLTISDNQGSWMPASKVSLVKPGGFYGYVQTKATGRWAPDGGRIDHKKVIPPVSFDQPIIWLPQNMDNSSGGQLWVDDSRWGPLSQTLLHSSFGKGHLFRVMLQEVGDVAQAAVTRLSLDFSTGIMRGRVNPADGQVYVTGLNGWNGGGRVGLRDKGVFRVRYTGKTYRMIDDCQVTPEGLKLSFNFDLDREVASNVVSFEGQQWNYKWTGNYGSPMFHPETGEEEIQELHIDKATVRDNGRSVVLQTPDLRVVNQLHLHVRLKDADGKAFEDEIYWTINALP
jgi:sugar lactone lactonase YvrE